MKFLVVWELISGNDSCINSNNVMVGSWKVIVEKFLVPRQLRRRVARDILHVSEVNGLGLA